MEIMAESDHPRRLTLGMDEITLSEQACAAASSTDKRSVPSNTTH